MAGNNHQDLASQSAPQNDIHLITNIVLQSVITKKSVTEVAQTLRQHNQNHNQQNQEKEPTPEERHQKAAQDAFLK